MEGDKEEDLQRKTDFPDEEKLCTWQDVDMDLDTICSSPLAISPLTDIFIWLKKLAWTWENGFLQKRVGNLRFKN